MYIIAGLGNPGNEYKRTRHNVGFMAADALAGALGASFSKQGFRSVYAETRIGTERVVIAKPETFMNNSGFAVSDLVRWFKIPRDRLIVIYDDIDLPCGAMRIRTGGSAGTHNGMRSITEQLGFEDFPRIRIGIGKPLHGLIDHVLGVPSDEDRALIDSVLPNVVEAVRLIVSGRIGEAQTRFSYKPPKKERSGEHHKDSVLDYRPEVIIGENRDKLLAGLRAGNELFFKNPQLLPAEKAIAALPYSLEDVLDAEARLKRFAPLIKKLFPETKKADGIIESALVRADILQKALLSHAGCSPDQAGELFIKLDSELPIAGSVKARGGIYEVLKHAEALALEAGVIDTASDYSVLAEHRELFSGYTVQVGSTGNLGLSIGISAAALGFKTIVHMSADAKQWKKDLLRSKGVSVVEYSSDYSEAVLRGRELSQSDPNSYFIDDESSLDLFMGYAVAALRLKKQLDELGVTVSGEHPLLVYLPCGVGGAPGGIAFALKLLFKDAVHCYFAEPVNAPCMLAAFACDECVHISSLGLNGMTDADGLAVGCASRLVYGCMKTLMDGEFTVSDKRLTPLVRLVHNTERLFIEPSSAVSAAAYTGLMSICPPKNAVHILWATGGGLVPADERSKYLR